MNTKTFDKEILQGLACEDYDSDLYEIMEDEIIDTSRWSSIYKQVFKDKQTGKFYTTTYSTGATECQDEQPYEYESDTITLDEVVAKEVTTIQYVKVSE